MPFRVSHHPPPPFLALCEGTTALPLPGHPRLPTARASPSPRRGGIPSPAQYIALVPPLVSAVPALHYLATPSPPLPSHPSPPPDKLQTYPLPCGTTALPRSFYLMPPLALASQSPAVRWRPTPPPDRSSQETPCLQVIQAPVRWRASPRAALASTPLAFIAITPLPHLRHPPPPLDCVFEPSYFRGIHRAFPASLSSRHPVVRKPRTRMSREDYTGK